MASRDNIDKKFRVYDTDDDGYLNPKQFSHFCRSVGVFLPHDDLVNIFTSLDRDYDRYVSKEDIQQWWIEYKYQKKAGNASSIV